ncbi:MAG: hemolysin family protein [Chloroflexota bacterium]
MLDIFFIILMIAIFVGLNGYFVAAEFSAVAVRRTKVTQMAAEGNGSAQKLLPILESTARKDEFLAATQIGITISSLVLGIYGQNAIVPRLLGPISNIVVQINASFTNNATLPDIELNPVAVADSAAFIVVITILTIIQVVLGELLPKSLAIQFPEQVATFLVRPMILSQWIMKLLIKFFNGSGLLILRLIPGASSKKGHAHSPEEIEILVTESHEGGMLDDQARQLLRNAFRLRDLTARQVMVHRTKMRTASEDSSILTLLELAIEAGFTRIPLHSKDSEDEIVGFVHVKDLFRLHVKKGDMVDDIIRKAVYVPETMPVLDIWEKLNNEGEYMVIVFDEFGSTTGMITFEDLIEEIFGELQDEFDDEMALIARDKEGRIHLRGDLLVSDVNEYLELDLPEETADTLGGLIISELGHPPKEGEEITIGTTVIQVEQMEDYGVQEVSLILAQENNVSSYSEWEVEDYE